MTRLEPVLWSADPNTLPAARDMVARMRNALADLDEHTGSATTGERDLTRHLADAQASLRHIANLLAAGWAEYLDQQQPAEPEPPVDLDQLTQEEEIP